MLLRLPLALTVVAAFSAGILASSVVRNASAQSFSFAATIYVPSDGLAFRTFDGRVLARLSHDEHGGVMELFDEHEQPAVRLTTVASVQAATVAPAASAAHRPQDALGERFCDPAPREV